MNVEQDFDMNFLIQVRPWNFFNLEMPGSYETVIMWAKRVIQHMRDTIHGGWRGTLCLLGV